MTPEGTAPLPAGFRSGFGTVAATVAAIHGEDGRAWADRLPDLVAAAARRWRLRLDPPYPAQYSWVAPATRDDGAPVVLKAVYPGGVEAVTERAVLELAAGHGYPALLAADPEAGLLLVERLEPAEPLTALAAADDDAATAVAAEVMRRVWLPEPAEHPFPTVERWGAGFAWYRDRYPDGGPIEAALLDRAVALFGDLLAGQDRPVVLHGDLHHGNVLSDAGRGWLAIDPKGVVGEPAYEVGALLRNPIGVAARPDLGRLLERRVRHLAGALDLDPARVAGWGAAHAVLSEIWSLQDFGHCDGDDLLVAAALLRVA